MCMGIRALNDIVYMIPFQYPEAHSEILTLLCLILEIVPVAVFTLIH